MYEISKNIPVPGSSRPSRYPIKNMEIGDSFEIPPDEWRTAHDCAKYYAKRNKGKKFTIRKMPNGNYRVWRIS